MAEVRRIFQSYDKDGNGYVTIDEAHDILEKVTAIFNIHSPLFLVLLR